MKKNVMFLSSFKNLDMLAVAKQCESLHVNHLVVKVMDGAKAVNEVTDNGRNDVIEKLLFHCKPRGIGVGAWVTIAGGDVGFEFRKLVNRIDKYATQLSGLVIEVTDGWKIRKPQEAVKYVGLIRKQWPGLEISLLDTTLGEVDLNEWIELVKGNLFVLCAFGGGAVYPMIVEKYRDYIGCYFSSEAKLDKVFSPVLGICDMPERSYKFNGAKILAGYRIVQNNTTFPAVGLLDWTPKGVEGIGDDGPLGIDKTVKELVWTRGESVPVDPSPTSDDGGAPSYEERLKALVAYAVEKGWIK